jgi:hypothetical protein
MADPVTENITQAVHSSHWTEGLAFAKWFAANAFIVVGGTFAAAFMILIFTIFVKALRGSNLSDLFVGEQKGQLSMTKFWTNVAYFSATLAFLAFNLLNQESGESQVMLWLIYLGTVGANAIASKWLALKYAPAGTTVLSNDPVAPYPAQPAPPQVVVQQAQPTLPQQVVVTAGPQLELPPGQAGGQSPVSVVVSTPGGPMNQGQSTVTVSTPGPG